MRIEWTTSLLAIVSCTALAFCEQVHQHGAAVLRLSQSGASQSKAENDNDVVEEAPEPSDSQELEARRAKSIRYNTGRRDLTTRDPEVEGFVEQVWPRRELIPATGSAVVATGKVVKVQPYLSSDRSRIYTEITVEVDDLLKRDRNNRLSAVHTVVIDRLGGALKLKTGRVVRDDIQIDNLGKTNIGKRYVFFARRVNDGSDISLIESYELRGGKVFTNDSRPIRLISTMPGVPRAWEAEATFLDAVRQEVRKEVGQLK